MSWPREGKAQGCQGDAKTKVTEAGGAKGERQPEERAHTTHTRPSMIISIISITFAVLAHIKQYLVQR